MKRLICICILSLVLLPAPGFAQGPHRGHDRGDHHEGFEFDPRMIEELNLSDDQRAALKPLREERQEARKDMLRLKIERMELQDLLKKETLDETKVLAQAEKVNQMMSELNLRRVKSMIRLKSILTPEQQNQLRRNMRQAMDTHKGPPWKNNRFSKQFRGRRGDSHFDREPHEDSRGILSDKEHPER